MQGYLTVALDQDRYVDMAVNLARSLRHFDKTRPICLVYNDKVSLGPDAKGAFTHFVNMPVREDYLGCMNKIRLDEASPFDETMYVDSDCLLVKGDIDRHWSRMSSGFFSMTGGKRQTGHWNSMDIAKTCEMFSIAYVVQMNSGVFYFKKGDEASRFFERLRELYNKHRDQLSNIHQGRKGQYADEPFFGVAMGEFGLEPLGGTPEQGSLMVTTWRAKNCDFRPEVEFSRIDKPASYWFGVSLLPRHWVRHSPTIAHFIGLKPRRLYERTANYFRRAAQSEAGAAKTTSS
ncbi:MAG TPA: hypothetical protein VGH23_05340 [Rhizomicrobium sp.]|jgi:hypothetical protein